MGYQGYIVRIVFVVVVAVAYSYKSEISEVVSTALKSFRGKNEAPSRKNTIPPHPPIKAPEPDYHNPTFDPDHPPEPLYSKSGVRLVTKNELKAHGSDGPLEPIWLAMMGKVFDVNQGAEHYYGPKGGYKFFSGIDGTKAFVTGEFNEEGLTDDVSEMTPLQLGEIDGWVKFYEKEYTYVGKLIGRYYTRDGSPTKEWYQSQKKLGEKDLIKAEQKKLEKQFPPCNSHWAEATKGKVYCTEKSGGVARDWVGYPRRFFAPGTKEWRCACINEKDLDSPHIRLYPDCDPNSHECKVDPDKIKKLRALGE